MAGKSKNRLEKIFKVLLKNYKEQYWWPAESFDEIVIGAILTQNTNWNNVEKAIQNLKDSNNCSLKKILTVDNADLAELIKPSGYYNVKTKRLKNTAEAFHKNDFEKYSNKILRKKLLNINGIGPETADSILLYAFNRETFVIDNYTKRIFSRIGFLDKEESYSKFKNLFEKNLKPNVKTFNEFHALIVRHAKTFCKTKPLCKNCILKELCKKKT